MGSEIHLVIVDDHPVVRKGLRQLIEEEPDLKVVGEAGDGETGLELIQKLRPEIALLDLDMHKLDGFAVAGEMQKRNLAARIIFLTIHSEADLLYRALDLGGTGYIVKESAIVDIVNGIRSVAAGRPFISPCLTCALLDRRDSKNAFERSRPTLADLTPAERRILSMVAVGKSTKQIADELHIHYRTVESHRGNICQKLDLNGPNTLLRFALVHKSELLGHSDSHGSFVSTWPHVKKYGVALRR
jgi:DNA-binding NarL/FixJ family response regulator